ncbi:MAG: hypothetical protein Q9217_001301 [Psora testacea]
MNARDPETSSSNDNAVSYAEDRNEPPAPPQAEAPRKRWTIRLRPNDDDEEQDWWWASTAIPLLAATTGPLANVLSIAALVTPWRNNYDPASPGVDSDSIGFSDPKWCLGLNGASLACGFVGNIFLLFNFTRRVRYIFALPMTIILWYFATGILTAITISMNEYVPPHRPDQTYSQGFWHAVIAAVLYLISSMALMLNMLGYFLGHYPQHFELSDEQRNLILQTMMFFIWLAGGAGVFAKVEEWAFVDALYFCDVTILTVGFGDFHPTNNASRGIVFPYSVGLMVSSIRKFAKQLGSTHVVQGHIEKRRAKTINRSATTESEYEHLKAHYFGKKHAKLQPQISAPFGLRKQISDVDLETGPDPAHHNQGPHKRTRLNTGMERLRHVGSRKPKILILKEEKQRFEAMRAIQRNTSKFKRYTALTMSVIAFGLLWCVGAIGFWKAEQHTQHLTYFQSLYFCYVSLLTIGYGDLSPTSNAGKPFFIVWSLIAIPTMTILISDMGDTVIASFKRGTFQLADWTVLPKAGIWRDFCKAHPWLLRWMQKRQQKEEKKSGKRMAEGFATGSGPADDGDVNTPAPTLEDVRLLDDLDENALARRLAIAIRRTANELHCDPPKRYTYEQWAEYTRLIRFSRLDPEQLEEAEEEEGLVEWDWIGEESPMLANKSESEWILDRLCESLDRFLRKQQQQQGLGTGGSLGNGAEKKDQ